MEVPIIMEISARHIHLSQRDADILFGKDYNFKILKELSQKGQFAYNETVEVESDAGSVLGGVRVMGPCRNSTYAEFSTTDLYGLKMKAPVMTESFDEKKMASPMLIKGPKGEIRRSAAIIKQRHIHCDLETATKYKIKDGAEVSVRCGDERAVTFHNVLVRIDANFTLRVHMNTDEANAAGIEQNESGVVIIEEK